MTATTTTAATRLMKAAKKPQRALSYNADTRILSITQDGKTTSYYVVSLSHDLGKAYRCVRLVKVGQQATDAYTVVSNATHKIGHCECLGNRSHGHCKHLDALRTLAELGKI